MSMRARRTQSLSMLGNGLAMLALAVLGGGLSTLQTAPWPGVTPLQEPRLWALAALLAFLAFSGWMLRPIRRDAATGSGITGSGAAQWHVAYATQTGFALELAQRTRDTLQAAGITAELHDIANLDPADFKGGRWLFVASTTGEGDPPDHALAFADRLLAADGDLGATEHAVLALGDRGYANYCQFGQQLEHWLLQRGSRRLFPRIEVDNADAQALEQWQDQVGRLTGRSDLPAWERPQYQPWRLTTRTLLNAGSPGGNVFHLALVPEPGTDAEWVAGDIAEIQPQNPETLIHAFLQASGLSGAETIRFLDAPMTLREALARSRLPQHEEAPGLDAQAVANLLEPLPHREYSIASIPGDGELQLLIRLMHRDDGTPGIGSGWLCNHARIGEAVRMRIRRNPSFHAPPPDTPMILIGNGTGLAGLRAHLKARIAQSAGRNWLLFGERTLAHDAFHGAELEAWRDAGHITHLTRVFSRDGGAHRYVQDALGANAARLLQWLDDGAAVYVCGSQEGMAPGVHAALVDVLGRDRVDALISAGRYRRDVY